ncbi:MAG TPA: carboxypeptidase regulatory-like domain-containing protein [Bryobacteraceae bacterium]|nr:carboxypeptidase regulatory-like domain-containing protein [Bryobacteraceae bacterium]
MAVYLRKLSTAWLAVTILLLTVGLGTQLSAQSLQTGDIAGNITDPSGAVVASATVTLKSLDTGATQTTQTNQAGDYRFTLLKPGHYLVSATQTGFQNVERPVDVAVGQIATVPLELQVGQATQTVEVNEAAPLISESPSQNTNFTYTQVQLLPSAGGDLTNIAFTAPGVVVNGTGGYGNFTMNGLPATSNLFTVNGENDMDPYFNINNSGASNLTLGQNEIQEVSVIANPYSGQFGQLSGAQVSYVTKSGTNEFHGNVQYLWNGRLMNSNDWFNNSSINGYTPRPFANANQWADSVGGPIFKNKTFFFFDNEGMHFVLPNVDSVTIPTAAFANAVVSNIQAKQPSEASTYQKMLGFWTGAPGAAAAQPLANTSACNSLVLPGFNPATQACAARFEATPTALAKEWILAFRVDHHISDKDNVYFRYKQDRGVQPTTLSPINPAFDALSPQPSWDSQLNETHIFGPHATNSFMGTFSYYKALFAQGPQAAATFPYQVVTSGAVPFTGFNSLGSFPQGRNISQYQLIDDYTLNRGRHNLKFGVNYRRYDVSDHNFFFNSPAVYFGYTGNGLQNFVNGLGYQYRKTLNFASDVPVALWGMGLYAMDEWSATANLKLTFALRTEHNSNPVCQFNCFANFIGPVSTLPSFTSAKPGSVPYSSDIAAGLHQAYPSTDNINWSPRIGFSWSPFNDKKTVISGGFGIFYDNVAASLVDDLLANPPAAVAIRVRPSTGVPVFDPGPAGGAAIWQASANAFSLNKTFSQISSQLAALGSVFAAPSFTALSGKLRSPQFQEWNLQVQRELSNSMVLTVNYVGNHGIHIPYSNLWPNAYDEFGLYPGVPGINPNSAVPNYGTVTTVQTGAISNYNGLSTTVTKRFSHWTAAHFNYTWSHNLDEVSNGGVNPYSSNSSESISGQFSPLGLRVLNYGNSEYDIRHNFSADFIVTPSYKFGNRFLEAALGGWQWSGKIFWRSGLPFSVVDGNTALGNFSTPIQGTYSGARGPAQTSCGEAAAVTPCVNAAAFVDASAATFNNYTGFSSQNRNQFRGPGFFDVDMALYKNFRIKEKVNFGVGLQAFNAFNHPNFAVPDATLGDSTFGQVTTMQGSPTSPYGNFLGFDSSVRVVQITGKIVF